VRTCQIVFIILATLLVMSSAVIQSNAQADPSANQTGGTNNAAVGKPAITIETGATEQTPLPPEEATGPKPPQPPEKMTAPDSEPPLVAEASPLNFKLSSDGTVATILFDRESVEAMRTLMTQLEQNGTLGKVKGIVYSASGITPMLILLGPKEELIEKLNILKQFIPDQNQAHIVVISASLRELADQDAYNIGLTLSPDIIGLTLGGTAQANFGTDQSDQYTAQVVAGLPTTDFSKIAQLNEAYNRGKVLVASEVYTRNGTKALLTNMQQIPIFSTDRNGNVMTSYQQLETSVDVIPTTIDYRKTTPEESQVRVDVLVKISVVTGEQTYNTTTTAPQYATKTFATTRVLKANNQRYVVGTFVNDAQYKSQVGLPFLSKIPLLKYFFSREQSQSQRNVAILTLAVKLIPMQVKDLTIDAEHVEPLEELYKRKGRLKDAR